MFSKIDTDFIDLIFFLTDTEKKNFISNLTNLLISLNVTLETDRPTVLNSIVYSNSELPFIAELFVFTGDEDLSGDRKLKNSYTSLRLCQINICKKLESNYYDFQFEESILHHALSTAYYNYSRIETLFCFGVAYYNIKNFEKGDYYFDLIANEKYELSPATISNFYKEIGNIYIGEGNKLKALEWLKKGIILNPKLPVKRIIKELEFNNERN